ncbi:hypothetical protein Pla108_18080 [Botrimarina colliarenosi]|uniref:Carboxypeptidase regulatory-like domain-containing protein n=1 Tax=Botrimarina colliarenosi TaxID=2528001 RepID=A0A5C6AE12_9BACT|nr:hypothetical protein Pla108_18080 [Botrimarina colliarenosi]
MKSRIDHRSPLSLLVSASCLLLVAGCDGPARVKVSGRVSRTDGAPVASARVLFRSQETGSSANGITNAEGHYELGGLKKGDGVPPGRYQVAINESRGGWDNPKPRTINAVYESPTTSGLECVVEASARSQVYDLELKPPSKTK